MDELFNQQPLERLFFMENLTVNVGRDKMNSQNAILTSEVVQAGLFVKMTKT